MKLKHIFAVLFAAIMMFALSAAASAAEYEDAAQDLALIGMFRGTSKGFELEREPTRSEAAIMLVRLYGAEETAKANYEAGKIKHPFTDVSAFTTPYVAYLYTNGITKGTSETTFGSANQCTLQNYTVFLLRALGYSDGTDFRYSDALLFAYEKGLRTSDLESGAFLRGKLAELTRRALCLNMKGKRVTLLDYLRDSGAIDSEKAAQLKENLRTVTFPVPTGEIFGLSGENAKLYNAVAEYLYREKYPHILNLTDTLLIPGIRVYGKYDGENGSTNYVCGIRQYYFYNITLDEGNEKLNAESLRGEQSGSSGYVACVMLDRDGVCTGITEYPDGGTVEEQRNYYVKICGPLTELAEQLSKGSAEGESIVKYDYRELFNMYLKYYYPQYYEEA